MGYRGILPVKLFILGASIEVVHLLGQAHHTLDAAADLTHLYQCIDISLYRWDWKDVD